MVKSQPILRYILRGIPAIAVAVLLSACSTNNTAKNMHPETRAVGSETSSLQASQDEFENLVRNVDVKSRIMDQYADWKGVRYRLGGSTKKGIDCSGFVQRTFREQFGLELPRSTYEQQEMGKSVSRSNLRTGDLVLFRAGSTGRHVGICLLYTSCYSLASFLAALARPLTRKCLPLPVNMLTKPDVKR